MEGKKFDFGKLDWSTLHPDVVAPLVEVCQFGENKYGFENWKNNFGKNYRRRFLAAIMRHYRAAYSSPTAVNDQDGGVYHLAQIAWDALTLLWHEQQRKPHDDIAIAQKTPCAATEEPTHGK